MSNVFSLFILVLLFIELLLSDGCIYYDGQRVRLKGLKKDELNGKYGIINNKNNNNNKERCGVLIDGETEPKAIKLENLDKIPTIFINGENHNLVDDKELYQFITDHQGDRIGLEFGENMIEEQKVYGIHTKNVFGFDNDEAKLNIQQRDRGPWMTSIVESMLFSNDEMFTKLETKAKMDLKEWRDMLKKWHCIDNFRRKFGNLGDMNEQHRKSESEGIQRFFRMEQDFFSKVEHLNGPDMGLIVQHLEEKAGFTEEKWVEIIDIWLELIKDNLIETIKNDEFVDQKKYNFIYQETLNENFVDIFNKYYHSEETVATQTENMTIIRDIMASQKIMEEYLKYYNQGSNIYIFIGDGHVKRLEFMIRKRLSLEIKNGDETHVGINEVHVEITEIFPEWIDVDDHDARDVSFHYYLDRTEQNPDEYE